MSALQKSLAGPKRYKNPCTECKRRKQKCNRIWPCIHCQKRDELIRCEFIKPNTSSCHFIERESHAARKNRRKNIAAAAQTTLPIGEEFGSATVIQEAGSKHSRDNGRDPDPNSDNDDHDTIENSAIEQLDDLDRLANQHLDEQLAAFGVEAQGDWPPFERQHDDQYCISASACTVLQEALDTLPQRRDHMDALVLSFFQNVNPHYSLIHQAEFAADYTEWWEKRANNDPLPVPWTCLLLMLCACACQHLPVDIQDKLEEMFHDTCQTLTDSYHYRARNLYGVIPAGKYHRNNVMWLLHSTYWYKAEAMFAECCHVFNTAVREAQELGFNTEESSEGLPNFEREMRRRAWCIIDSWDWQIASGLCRDTLIDHSTCNVERPSLTLELDGQFSPLMHMNMQSDLIHKLAERFHSPAKITTPSDIMEYKAMIAEWMQDFPPIFALENPDTSFDEKQTWIEYHRHYNYTMGYMMMLNPFRPHMKIPFTEDTSEDILELRAIAVDLSIRLVKVLDDWINYLTFRDGRFHFIIFSLVDAATMLANIISNDKAGTVPRREEIYNTIKATRAMQGTLFCLSNSAKLGFRIIHKTFRQLVRTAPAEDLAFLEDEKDDDDGQEVLAAALNSISLQAPKNDSSVESKNRTDPGTQKRQKTEILAEESPAEHTLQPVYDIASPPPNHDDTSAVSSDSIDSTIYECHAPTSPRYTVAATAPPDYDEHMASGPGAVVSSEYILSMPPIHAPVAPLNYTTAVPLIHSTFTSSYVDPTNYAYDEAVPLGHVGSASLGYATTTTTSLAGSAVAPAYMESSILGHDLPLDYIGDVSSDHTTTTSLDYDTASSLDYAAVPSSNYSTAPSLHVEPALDMLSTSAYPGYTQVMPAVDFVPNSELFSAPTTYDTHASNPTYLDYHDAGFGNAYEHYSGHAVSQTFASLTAPTAFTMSAPYTFPESYAPSGTYNVSTMYNTFAPSLDPTTYASSATSFTPPETDTSLGDLDMAAAYTATAATAACTPYTPTNYYSENTAHTASSSNSHETPESNYTPPADTTAINKPTSSRV